LEKEGKTTLAVGFVGKYHSVRRFVRRLGHSQPLPFRRMENNRTFSRHPSMV
jgi:hypothetical protein